MIIVPQNGLTFTGSRCGLVTHLSSGLNRTRFFFFGGGNQKMNILDLIALLLL